jgi:hypothetical protein
MMTLNDSIGFAITGSLFTDALYTAGLASVMISGIDFTPDNVPIAASESGALKR